MAKADKIKKEYEEKLDGVIEKSDAQKKLLKKILNQLNKNNGELAEKKRNDNSKKI